MQRVFQCSAAKTYSSHVIPPFGRIQNTIRKVISFVEQWYEFVAASLENGISN